MKTPSQGDFILLDFDPQAGHEQIKRRPALVLSPANFNATFGLAFVMPITTKPKNHLFEVALPSTSRIKGVIMAHQLKSLDWQARKAEIVGRCPTRIVAAAREIVKDIIG